MQQFYRIHPSRALFGLSLAAHAIVALAIIFYADTYPLIFGGVVLVLLVAWRESVRRLRQPGFSLGFDPRRQLVTLLRDGQPYFQGKYKVYATRWFAILKLIDNRSNRILILHRLRFDTDRSYRHLRFALADREQHRAA